MLAILTALARLRLKRLRLYIVGVTGSIGKTSTKEALYTALSSRYRVYRSDKSFNTEFGLPLAILEQPSGYSSPPGWIKVLFGSLWSAFFGGRHMQMLVLEMGVDKPGDMSALLKIVHPQLGVFTNVKPVHLAEGQFKDLDDIFLEKRKLIDALPEKGTAILNADDPYVAGLRNDVKCKKILYGFSEIADVRVFNIKHSFEGLEFSVTYKGQVVTSTFSVLGSFQVYVLLPAIAASLAQGFTLEEAVAALRDYKLPPGRMNPIPGIKETLIIDSSYNASPEAVKEALDVLTESPGRKMAVLGSMNELGEMSERKHREVGRYASARADVLLTVGETARWIHEEARLTGFPADMLAHFDDAEKAAEHARNILKRGDTILVKGSQNRVRLEKFVRKLMREPDRAEELLARQGTEWKKIQ
ncbi:MAG TPA: UDP-N-acetylmuramoyl-tripeptide--D-alanyl-D-alanine ligase [Candidatus Gracilibacteria bacterium]|nr:UDP-N-acetylmuramoyl-tripeptide--D-alanyl-D-alanine ligase [Candidatus Gracilibacteria bacterium]